MGKAFLLPDILIQKTASLETGSVMKNSKAIPENGVKFGIIFQKLLNPSKSKEAKESALPLINRLNNQIAVKDIKGKLNFTIEKKDGETKDLDVSILDQIDVQLKIETNKDETEGKITQFIPLPEKDMVAGNEKASVEEGDQQFISLPKESLSISKDEKIQINEDQLPAFLKSLIEKADSIEIKINHTPNENEPSVKIENRLSLKNAEEKISKQEENQFPVKSENPKFEIDEIKLSKENTNSAFVKENLFHAESDRKTTSGEITQNKEKESLIPQNSIIEAKKDVQKTIIHEERITPTNTFEKKIAMLEKEIQEKLDKPTIESKELKFVEKPSGENAKHNFNDKEQDQPSLKKQIISMMDKKQTESVVNQKGKDANPKNLNSLSKADDSETKHVNKESNSKINQSTIKSEEPTTKNSEQSQKSSDKNPEKSMEGTKQQFKQQMERTIIENWSESQTASANSKPVSGEANSLASQQTSQSSSASQTTSMSQASSETTQTSMSKSFSEQIAKLQETVNQQIVKSVQGSIGSERSHIRLQLEPQHLGKVHIQMKIENGMLTAHLTAMKTQTRTMLEQNLNQLKTSFEDQGIKVDRLVVTRETSESRSQDQGKDEAHDRSSRPKQDAGGRSGNQQGGSNKRQNHPHFNWQYILNEKNYYA